MCSNSRCDSTEHHVRAETIVATLKKQHAHKKSHCEPQRAVLAQKESLRLQKHLARQKNMLRRKKTKQCATPQKTVCDAKNQLATPKNSLRRKKQFATPKNSFERCASEKFGFAWLRRRTAQNLLRTSAHAPNCSELAPNLLRTFFETPREKAGCSELAPNLLRTRAELAQNLLRTAPNCSELFRVICTPTPPRRAGVFFSARTCFCPRERVSSARTWLSACERVF